MVRRLNKKPSATLARLARKYKVKISLKRGSKRIYKSEKLLKKQIGKKMRISVRKARKAHKVRKIRRVRRVRRSRFGQIHGSEYKKDVPGYGYNMPVVQIPGAGPQSSELVMNADMNSRRPDGSKLEDQYVPTYGTYAAFFDQAVPRVIPPNWEFMGQPDGTTVGLGSPFYRYTSAFGKRSKFGKSIYADFPNFPSQLLFGKRRKQYMVEDSKCNKHRKAVCQSMPNCTYTTGRGCRRRKGTVKGGLVYEGPSLAAFGKRSKFGKSIYADFPNFPSQLLFGKRRRFGASMYAPYPKFPAKM